MPSLARLALALTLLSSPILAQDGPMVVSPCCKLADAPREALQGIIPPSLLGIDQWCGTGSYRTIEEVVRHGQDLLPCLLHVYWHGIEAKDLCASSQDPTNGKWTLWAIQMIDERAAIGILEAEASLHPEHRLGYQGTLLKLGQRQYLPTLLEALLDTSPQALSRAQKLRIVEIIGTVDARDALPVLREVRQRQLLQDWLLDMVIAQLDRDGPALLSLAETGDPPDPPPVRVIELVSMLDRIGFAREALTILQDRASRPGPYQVWARNELRARAKPKRTTRHAPP